MRGRGLLLSILLFSGVGPLRAHTVPTLEVEAEFTAARGFTLHVNVDARLFLSSQPSTLPPVPASWWLDQDEDSRAKSMAEARAYVARTLFFSIGDKKLDPSWKVVAIDSNTMFPLAPSSAEAHLLCDYVGVLPETPGAFQVKVADNCAVGVILLNSLEGNEQRYPQSLFPGETSRRFALPDLRGQGVPTAQPPPEKGEASLQSWFIGSSAQVAAGDVLMVMLLAAVLGGRFWTMVCLLLAFHLGQGISGFAVQNQAGSAGPGWLAVLGWVMLLPALGVLLFPRLKRRFPIAVALMAGAGCCQGWSQSGGNWIRHNATLLLWQLAFAAVICLAWRVLERARAAQAVVDKAS